MTTTAAYKATCDYCREEVPVPFQGDSPKGWVWAHFEIDSRIDICPKCQKLVTVEELRRVLPRSGHDRNKHSPEAIQIRGL